MLIWSICLFFISAVQAQEADAKFVKAMEKALSGLDTLQTAEQWLAASNKFERIAQKHDHTFNCFGCIFCNRWIYWISRCLSSSAQIE